MILRTKAKTKQDTKQDAIRITDSTPTLVGILLFAVVLMAGVFYYSFHGLSSGPPATYQPVTEAGNFQVTIVDDKGKTLPETTVIHTTPDKTSTTHTSDHNGRVSLSGIKGERQTLEITNSSFETKKVSMSTLETTNREPTTPLNRLYWENHRW